MVKDCSQLLAENVEKVRPIIANLGIYNGQRLVALDFQQK